MPAEDDCVMLEWFMLVCSVHNKSSFFLPCEHMHTDMHRCGGLQGSTSCSEWSPKPWTPPLQWSLFPWARSNPSCPNHSLSNHPLYFCVSYLCRDTTVLLVTTPLGSSCSASQTHIPWGVLSGPGSQKSHGDRDSFPTPRDSWPTALFLTHASVHHLSGYSLMWHQQAFQVSHYSSPWNPAQFYLASCINRC